MYFSDQWSGFCVEERRQVKKRVLREEEGMACSVTQAGVREVKPGAAVGLWFSHPELRALGAGRVCEACENEGWELRVLWLLCHNHPAGATPLQSHSDSIPADSQCFLHRQ